MQLTQLLVSLAAATLAAAQSCSTCDAPDPKQNLPFTSVVSGPWYQGSPGFPSLSGTKVIARGGRLRLSNVTTAQVTCQGNSGASCSTDTVIFVNGQTGRAYLDALNPASYEIYIHPTQFYVGYTTPSTTSNRKFPKGALTGNFMRVGDNPTGQTTSPPTCTGCSEGPAPAIFTWPIQGYANSFYACPDNAQATIYTLYEKILYQSASPPQNCIYVQLAALNYNGANPAVGGYQ